MSNIYQSHASHIHIKAQIQLADVFIKGPASAPGIRRTTPTTALNLHCKIFICFSCFCSRSSSHDHLFDVAKS